MTVELRSEIGFTASVPDGSILLPDSNGGPVSAQISLPDNVLLTVVRDDELIHDYAQVLEWTQKMAAFYQSEFDGTVLTEGSLQSEGKKVYVVVVRFDDAEGVPRIASVAGVRFLSGEFFGLTLNAVNPDPEPSADIPLIQSTVDGLSL